MSRAFSNGTEYEMWAYNWCHVCLVDAPFRNGIKGANGCPILAAAILGNEVPPQWIEQTPWEEHYPSDAYHCIEFRPPGWRNPEPKPEPTPPGQDSLFPREGFEGTRMLKSDDRKLVAS